jgi:hypothetical protein
MQPGGRYSRSDSVESCPVGASCFRPASDHCLTLTLSHPIPPQPLVIWKGEYRVSSVICTFLYPGAPYNTICFLELHNFPFQFTKILPLICIKSHLKFSKHVSRRVLDTVDKRHAVSCLWLAVANWFSYVQFCLFA